MEAVGPNGQNVHFSRSKIPGAGKPPILTIFLALTTKRPILKIKRALVLEKPPFYQYLVHEFFGDPELWSQLALTAKTTHFKHQTSPRANKALILLIFGCYNSPSFLLFGITMPFLTKFFMDFTIFIGDPKFRCHFCRILLWTFVEP
ncbi:hypothetical protein H5410_053013 [Solanum commersonii]|uniref:Uncharacterized protein n=1 Tax=Solanum commersonii TaxID=4109 RepID=A0A9J5X360_SOLCO|nr:hypothetical protein H5410_053013 [Solanum commersonii]